VAGQPHFDEMLFGDVLGLHLQCTNHRLHLGGSDAIMNDRQIREFFHRKRLRRHHADGDTVVVDELGLKHGRRRADIAVVNGHLIGYEIKSDEDSLCRLDEQIKAYGDVFDRATVIVGTKHADAVFSLVPEWWGIIISRPGARGGISFETARPPGLNRAVDPFSVAQLLWSNEATNILAELGVPQKTLRQRRAVLYQLLVEMLRPDELRRRVRECLKNRRNWRCPPPPSPDDGSSPPYTK